MASSRKAKEILLTSRRQITIPKEFLSDGVTQFRAELREEDGAIILLPRVSIPAHQKYYWTKKWQKGEAKASEDIDAGRLSKPGDASDVQKSAKAAR